jgi:hypothetical protein
VLPVRAYPQQTIVQWLVQLARQCLKEFLLSDEIARVIEVVLHDQFVVDHESDASGTGVGFTPGLECIQVLEDTLVVRYSNFTNDLDRSFGEHQTMRVLHDASGNNSG